MENTRKPTSMISYEDDGIVASCIDDKIIASYKNDRMMTFCEDDERMASYRDHGMLASWETMDGEGW